MPRRAIVAVGVLLMLASCSSGNPRADAKDPDEITFASLGIDDWPRAGRTVDAPDLPDAPKGFDQDLVDRLGESIVGWASAASLDDSVWHAAELPASIVTAYLPKAAAKYQVDFAGDAVSPRLWLGDVFGKDVRVVGRPRQNAAWKVATKKNDDGRRFLTLVLQTRTAFEVRDGDGPVRVIGVLRLHALNAFPGTADSEITSGGGWQVYGNAACPLALEDAFVPENGVEVARKDLRTFVAVGSRTQFGQPTLGNDDRVDDQFAERCRNGSV